MAMCCFILMQNFQITLISYTALGDGSGEGFALAVSSGSSGNIAGGLHCELLALGVRCCCAVVQLESTVFRYTSLN